jgi:hypothetical protein
VLALEAYTELHFVETWEDRHSGGAAALAGRIQIRPGLNLNLGAALFRPGPTAGPSPDRWQWGVGSVASLGLRPLPLLELRLWRGLAFELHASYARGLDHSDLVTRWREELDLSRRFGGQPPPLPRLQTVTTRLGFSLYL